MAFCKSFLNHMKWHYIYLLSSSIHLSPSIFTLHYIYLLYVGDIIERDLSLWGLLQQKFYLLDFNYRKPTRLSPVTSTNVGVSSKNFLTCDSFNFFATLVWNFKSLRSACPKLLGLNQEHPSKKAIFLIKSF